MSFPGWGYATGAILKQGQRWQQAAGAVDEEFQRLIGAGADAVARLAETELLARLIRGEPTQAVREKTLILTSLLKEAGDAAATQGRAEEGRSWYLKGLHLLLETLAREEVSAFPDLVPKVEIFAAALRGSPLPLKRWSRGTPASSSFVRCFTRASRAGAMPLRRPAICHAPNSHPAWPSCASGG